MRVRSKPAPFAEKKNAKSAAPAKAEPAFLLSQKRSYAATKPLLFPVSSAYSFSAGCHCSRKGIEPASRGRVIGASDFQLT